ncbi:ribonuclease H-like domain-containing protein [Mycena crocata]|nr:ribonuclease H-like domain-containing protein [Mycena crocata]
MSIRSTLEKLRTVASKVLTIERNGQETKTDPSTVSQEKGGDPRTSRSRYFAGHAGKSIMHYLISKREVNKALKGIVGGVIGFDTEFVPRQSSDLDKLFDEVFETISGSRKTAMLACQIIEIRRRRFKILWDIIAKGNDVWVINMTKIRGVPNELKRIIISETIAKAGVGMISDLQVIWADLGLEMKNVVDVGLMARLLLVESYADGAYANLSMVNAMRDVLGFTISKKMQKSNWKGDDNELTEEQKKYAAIDANASLKLYEALVPRLQKKAADRNINISEGWFTFNSSYGEPTRKQRTYWGKEAPWSTRDCPWFFDLKSIPVNTNSQLSNDHIQEGNKLASTELEVLLGVQSERVSRELAGEAIAPHDPGRGRVVAVFPGVRVGDQGEGR